MEIKEKYTNNVQLLKLRGSSQVLVLSYASLIIYTVPHSCLCIKYFIEERENKRKGDGKERRRKRKGKREG